MAFWAYMLHCRGGYFYVGHTDNLESRVSQHKHGAIPGFTAGHRPVELVWSELFATRDEAKACEKQIKGWSRAKKLALIRGDWERISALAKGKGSPSTGSGQAGMGRGFPNSVGPEFVEKPTFILQPHPDDELASIKSVYVRVFMDDQNGVLVEFNVEGTADLILPEWKSSARRDGLWQTTCFEMFLKLPDEPAYWEFNFSPSTEWAIYAFDEYRGGMREMEAVVEPHIEFEATGQHFQLEADVDLAGTPQGQLIAGFSAVIEEKGGRKSYWALAHPPGKPDFHHPSCFAASLPPPDQP